MHPILYDRVHFFDIVQYFNPYFITSSIGQ